jgi:hypothetical protein
MNEFLIYQRLPILCNGHIQAVFKKLMEFEGAKDLPKPSSCNKKSFVEGMNLRRT